ncbi:hypothetical protein [Streptomyces sp. M92]|uniref:hypothetical protein n=1 Tax=Streptomyces sp. M92 TaxID=2944250 RepID=UPI002349091C|nr:hypothetical protein [Streptomyces sp. M92]WCN04923.1 hypothetical protein M6G08_23915 [Streptomyces sp. M92]
MMRSSGSVGWPAGAPPLAHRDDPDFFAESRFARPEAEQVKVPLLHIGSWLAHFPANTVRQYCLTRDHADPAVRDAQRLVMEPWGHGGFTRNEFGSVFPGGAVDYAGMNVEWLGRRLRGYSLTRPDHPVVLYVMGADRWRAEHALPRRARPLGRPGLRGTPRPNPQPAIGTAPLHRRRPGDNHR